jgi:hypothetical protein
MNQKRAVTVLALAFVVAALSVGGAVLRRAAPVAAQTSASYNLEWHVIGGGGQPVASASYAVNSTAGQGAASQPYSFSSHYVVSGGYWFGDGLTLYSVHLPLVFKRYP